MVLWQTDLDFRLRLALSEPALRAEARQLPRGVRKRYWPIRGASGLFKVYEVEEKDGCTLWNTGPTDYWGTEGLAYLPMGKIPKWAGYRFQHIQGPWWSFIEQQD